jgi:hypothetical protein
MPATYEKIATTTLGSTSSTISFGSIGSGYTDLRLVLAATNTASLDLNLTFNSDTATNYSRTQLTGNGSVASSTRSTSAAFIRANFFGMAASEPYLLTLDLFSYAGSTFKTCLIENSEDKNGSGGVCRMVGLYRSTSAITTITFTTSTSTFAVGTSATLYGILKA